MYSDVTGQSPQRGCHTLNEGGRGGRLWADRQARGGEVANRELTAQLRVSKKVRKDSIS